MCYMDKKCSFDNMRFITGGDPVLEIDLLETFLTTSREYIAKLHAANESDDVPAWSREAHGMKGGCFNIGAEYLGEMCLVAQRQAQESRTIRTRNLQAIQDEFARLEPLVLSMIEVRHTQMK